MKKVLLLGDSIRKSYCERVAELLRGKADVTFPDDNCRYTAYTLFLLRSWLDDQKYDYIQWNNGQWDTARMLDGVQHTPLEQYVANTTRIARILSDYTTHLVFATTSPVNDDNFDAWQINPRTNEDINAYNAAARAAVEPLGVKILDLNQALAEDTGKYLKDDRVHLSPAGVERAAEAVAANIQSLLGETG